MIPVLSFLFVFGSCNKGERIAYRLFNKCAVAFKNKLGIKIVLVKVAKPCAEGMRRHLATDVGFIVRNEADKIFYLSIVIVLKYIGKQLWLAICFRKVIDALVYVSLFGFYSEHVDGAFCITLCK